MPQRPQHRPKRDSQKTQEMADLKRRNHQLKRLLTRMRKQLDQSSAMVDPEYQEILHEEAPRKPDAVVCNECGCDDMARFSPPGGYQILVCRSCKVSRAA